MRGLDQDEELRSGHVFAAAYITCTHIAQKHSPCAVQVTNAWCTMKSLVNIEYGRTSKKHYIQAALRADLVHDILETRQSLAVVGSGPLRRRLNFAPQSGFFSAQSRPP